MIDREKLDAYLHERVKEKDLPGVAACVLGPDGIIFEGYYGYRDADLEIPVDAGTVFGIASMSKSMVALALCMLEAEGKLSIDEAVYRFIPAFRVPGLPRDAVTIRHLLTHTAGIPPIEILEWSISMNTPGEGDERKKRLREAAKGNFSQLDEILDYIANCPHPTLAPPGMYMSYCNEGYAILSRIVDIAAGEPLETFLNRRVFAPLGMTRSVLDVDASEARAISGGNITALFERRDGKRVCDEQWSVLPPYRGCGLVKSTARDMAAYYRALSRMGGHVFPKEAVLRMIGPDHPAPQRPHYALGLDKRSFRGHQICEHGGGLHGVSSHGALLMDEGYGFCVLCNQGEENVQPLMWAMINAVIGAPLDESHEWAKPSAHPFSDPGMVIGAYRGHEGLPEDITVFEKQGALYARTSETELLLTFCGGTLFIGGDPVRLRLEFYVSDGRAWAVRCGSRIFHALDIQ